MRSVVRKPAVRCDACLLPPRWCVCAALQPLDTPLAVSVLSHRRELHKPSSTGNLIKRLLPASNQHCWDPAQPVTREQVALPDRDLWVLHPQGGDMPAVRPASVQVLLLDGAWSQTLAMTRHVGRWGTLVRLPMQGASRFWLRAQHNDDRFSTMEALLFLLEAFALTDIAEKLRLQFELHVYAGLRARGSKELAAQYLATSPLQQALTDHVATLQTPRPL